VTLDRPDLSRRFILVRYPRKLPNVLSVEEVGRLLEAAPGLKHKAALGTAYGAGLRVSEVAALKIDDVDSTRMLIRVEQGKGRRDRNAMLSPQLLALLRLWWREGKQRGVMLSHGWGVSDILCAGPVDHHAVTNRASNMMANCVFASDHSRGGIFQSAAT
jgi:integrase